MPLGPNGWRSWQGAAINFALTVSMRDTKNHEILCETAKVWYAGFFIAAWKVLFNETICRIEPAMEN